MKALVPFVFLASLALASSATASCNAFATRITTTPVLYQWTSALEKASALLDTPPARADSILLGDSLLAFWPRDLAAKQFGAHSVWNFAVGGSRTQHILWQLDNLAAPMLRPREVVVLIGTNNLSDEKLPVCAIVEGIKAVAARVRKTWPETSIWLMGIPPRGSDFHFRDDDRKAINASIRAWTKGQIDTRYFEVDDMVMTCGRYGGLANVSANANTGSRCENYADDFGHFRRPGYEVIYAALRRNAK